MAGDLFVILIGVVSVYFADLRQTDYDACAVGVSKAAFNVVFGIELAVDLVRVLEFVSHLCDEVDPPWLRLQFSSDKTHSHYLHIMINQVAYYTISKSRIAISWLFLLCITN